MQFGIYDGFRVPRKKRAKPGEPKKKTYTVSGHLSQLEYEDFTVFSHYRHLKASEVVAGLWRRYKAELELAGEWPPKQLDESDQGFEENISRVELQRGINEAERRL